MTVTYPFVLYLGIPLLIALAAYRWWYHKKPVYLYSSTMPLHQIATHSWLQEALPFMLRLASLFCLLFAVARLRTPHERTLIPVEGIDIMIVLDASYSMTLYDEEGAAENRLESAKREAIEFIKRRTNDPIGLVVFSGGAVTRSPLTLDKNMLETVLQDISVISIPERGTVLTRGILVGANRLKDSKASSRILIVLTDGMPTDNDVPVQYGIDVAKKLGIKVYTIGIGGDIAYEQVARGFWARVPGQQYDERILKEIAQQTGGAFFQARSAEDMKAIYDTIDKLERSEQQLPVYAHYVEYFIYFLWAALVLFLCELLITAVVWVRL